MTIYDYVGRHLFFLETGKSFNCKLHPGKTNTKYQIPIPNLDKPEPKRKNNSIRLRRTKFKIKTLEVNNYEQILL
jgi:hypothetical protein